jgi:hypothetical protein
MPDRQYPIPAAIWFFIAPQVELVSPDQIVEA